MSPKDALSLRRGRGPLCPPPTLPALALVLSVWCALLLSVADGAIVEYFFTVGTINIDPTCSGTLRPTVVVNGEFPGPTIYAESGDTLMVHVTNNQTYPTTIHWHGLTSEEAQWYDGVPGITQCEIKKGQTYTYIIPIKGQWGTFWYHSHSNMLRNTVHGAVVIKPPRNHQTEPMPVFISKEFLLLGGDWYPQSPKELEDTINTPPFSGFPLPAGLHLNGRTLCTGPPVFPVRRNKWYRLRLVNTGLWSSWNLQVEKHSIYMFETEGGYLQRNKVSSLDVYPGQSYSVLLYTNQKANNYWIGINARYDVTKAVKLPAAAVLSYEEAGLGDLKPDRPLPTGPTGTSAYLNDFGIKQQSKLRSPYFNQDLPTAPVDKLIMLEMNQNTLSDKKQLFGFNNASFTAGKVPFLLADYQGTSASVYSSTLMPDLPPAGFQNQKDGPTKQGPSVLEVPYGAWVQVVFQNHLPPGGMHPFHIHGQQFYIVATGKGRFYLSRWREYKYNLVNPIIRNTVATFENHWAAVRFRAMNPGQWIIHCHLEQHADQGLIAILKVNWPPKKGNAGPLPLSKPPTDYPTCSS